MILAAAFILAGLLAGVASGVLGIGGSLVATPAIRLLGVTPYLAVGTTVPMMLPTALTGAFTYARSGHIDARAALIGALAAAPFAVAGARLTRSFNGHVLMVATALVLMVVGILSVLSSPPAGGESPPRRRLGAIVAAGAGAGFLSGLLGIGGGILLVPAFHRLAGMSLKQSLGTSLAVIGITSIPSAAAHWAAGNIDWKVAGLLAAGVVPGARLGAGLSIAAEESRLKLVFAAGVLVVAAGYGLAEAAAIFSR